MRTPAMILGVVMIVVGGLIAAGVFKYTDTKKVLDIGDVKVESSTEKKAPMNWGYLLLGGGVIVLVVGAATGRTR